MTIGVVPAPSRAAKATKIQPSWLVLANDGNLSKFAVRACVAPLLHKEDLHHLLQIGRVYLDGREGVFNLGKADAVVPLHGTVDIKVASVLLNHLAAVPDLGEPKRGRRTLEKVAQF